MNSVTMQAQVTADDYARQRKLVHRRYRHASLIYRWLSKEAWPAVVPIVSLHNLDRLTRQRQTAISKGWLGAKKRIESTMLTILASISLQADDAIASLRPSQPSPQTSIAEIAADLAALESDFAAVMVSRRGQTLSVTTEPIELDGVYLGPFQICLESEELGRSIPYRVIAKDPHPASTSDSTTHPHVSDEALCEGDGHTAIRRALSEGRLFDFFVIVRQVLNTYNPHSAYVSLDDWDGIECQDCGDTVDTSDSDCCSRCDGRVCRKCSCLCNGCEDVYCDDCTSPCEGCDSRFCSGCLKTCDGCDNQFCNQCLKEDRCDDCLEEEKEKLEKAANATETAVHPVCVGEATVPT